MYCTKCGTRNEDSSKFCVGCGNPLIGSPTPQPDNTVASPGVAATPQVGSTSDAEPRHGESRSRARVIAIVIVVCALLVAVAILLFPQFLGGDKAAPAGSQVASEQASGQTAGQASDAAGSAGSSQAESQADGASEASGSAEAPAAEPAEPAGDAGTTEPAEAQPTPEQQALQSVDGWWQSVGQSGSAFHHFVNGIDYLYARDLEDHDSFTYSTTRRYTVEPFEAGSLGFTDDSGIAVLVEGGNTYILEDSQPNVLSCRNLDGSGYSGSSSLGRPDPSQVTDSLVQLANEIEGANSPEPAPEAAGPEPEPASDESADDTRVLNATEFARAYFENNRIVDSAAGAVEGVTDGAARCMQYVEPGSDLEAELNARAKDSVGNFMTSAAVVVHDSSVVWIDGDTVAVSVTFSASQGNRDNWLEETESLMLYCTFAEDDLITFIEQDGVLVLTGSV